MTRPQRVIIESPYAGKSEKNSPEYFKEVEENLKYCRACMRDSFLRGEFPYASHILFTQKGILDDTIPEERKLGMEAGLDWGELADLTVVYTDIGMSCGMEFGIKRAEEAGRPIEYRTLEDFTN